MTIMKKFLIYLLTVPALALLASCKDKESYADLLRDENHAVNAYLANYPVITSVPADRAFISTQDILADPAFRAEFKEIIESPDPAVRGKIDEIAVSRTPFYRMDSDGYVYMQVVNPGTGEYAETGNVIFFRFTRYNLAFAYKYDTWEASGNESDVASNPTSFRYKDTTLSSTTQWGEGIQVPLEYLRLNCEVNLIIKSYLGPTQEVSSVYPYLYTIRYYPSRI
jgi:lipoprotein